MTEDTWMTAWEAVQRLAPHLRMNVTVTICKRANAGLIPARARLIMVDDQAIDSNEIPKEFWWAEGQAALTQNWPVGDFSTYLRGRGERKMKVFGVQFAKDSIEEMLPATILQADTSPKHKGYSNQVFIVHGRDEGPREAVANVLTSLGLVPIILNQKANKGMSVIEKIEAYADVGYAVVLLTPDDVGSLNGEVQQARARQNVIMELGYFIGKLGRSRVSAFIKGDLEIPTDWAGIINERYDDLNGAWKFLLARELKAAEYDIDLNRIA